MMRKGQLTFLFLIFLAFAGEVCAQTLHVTKDLSIEGDLTVANNAIYVDAGNNYVGIQTLTPSTNVHVAGDMTVSQSVTVSELHFQDGTRFTSESIFYGYDGVGGVDIDEGLTITLNIDTALIQAPAYSLAADVITINEAGTYEIRVFISIDGSDTSGNQRAQIFVTLQQDSGAGFVNMTNGRQYIYSRESTDTWGELFLIQNFSGGEDVRVQLWEENPGATSSNPDTSAAKPSRIFIRKLTR